MADNQKWPDVIWLARHGESAGNVARRVAESAGLHVIDIPTRDADVALSDEGRNQALALGRWFGQMPPDERPDVVLTSPYLRARFTAEHLLEAAGIDLDDITYIVDERLREREFGILDRLTKLGVRQKYPEEAEHMASLGKFYHRPPGGESWCDVILRLRSIISTITRDYCGDRVLIVTHQVVIHCFRYLFERMTEDQILAVDREKFLANCSITSYRFDPALGHRGRLRRDLLNFVAPLAEAGAEITTAPDVPVAPK